MEIILLSLILAFIFIVWVGYTFFTLALASILNIIVIWLCALFIIRDFRKRSNIAMYFLAISISLGIYIIGVFDIIANFFSKFMIFSAFQFVVLVVVTSQILISTLAKTEHQ
jgi:hypothetical protein